MFLENVGLVLGLVFLEVTFFEQVILRSFSIAKRTDGNVETECSRVPGSSI